MRRSLLSVNCHLPSTDRPARWLPIPPPYQPRTPTGLGATWVELRNERGNGGGQGSGGVANGGTGRGTPRQAGVAPD